MLDLLTPSPITPRGLVLIAGALALMYVLCAMMYAVRVVHAGELKYWWIPANLVLAWFPFVLAVLTQALYAGFRTGRPLAVFAAGLWLLFLPNAPYVVTDLQHYRPTPLVPGWYDGAMLGAFVTTGVLSSVVSLYIMQSVVAGATNTVFSWVFVLGVLPLCGFGIYLGRVLRWHSWHVITAPVALLRDVIDVLRYPALHSEAYYMTAVFAALFAATYTLFYSFAAGISSQHG